MKRRLLKRGKATELMDRCVWKASQQDHVEAAHSDSEGEVLNEVAFPNLPDNILKALGVFGNSDINKNLNEPDIEERFARLSLAFKTDKFTLCKRLELQQRQRDIAEKNIDCELKSLRESLNALNQLCTDCDMREVITKTQQHVDIVQQATMRMSSRAETFGAIQQEQRMNCAFETMLSYVEHLKLIYDKEHIELEEYRRLLAEHNLLPDEKGAGDATDVSSRMNLPRSHSMSSTTKPESRARLLSAICLLSNTHEGTRPAHEVSSSSNISLSPKSRRSSLPVGPMSSATLNVNLFPVSTNNRNHDSINENLEVSKEEVERIETTAVKQLVRTDSAESDTRSEEVKESDSSQEICLMSLCGDESTIDKDSSGVKRHPLRSFEDKIEAVPNFCTLQETCDNEKDSETSLCCDHNGISIPVNLKKPSSLYKLHNWAVEQGVWRWDSGTIILRARYMLSAMLAMAAVLSFVLTFMPHRVVACSGTHICN